MKNLFHKWLSALLIAALLLTPVAMMEEAFEPLPEAIEEPAQAPAEEAPTEGEESEPVEIVTPEAVDEITEEDADAVLDDLDPTVQVNVDLPDEKLLFAPMFEESGDDITINGTNFPDDFFRDYILNTIDNGDHLLSPDEIAKTEEIYLSPDVIEIDDETFEYESKSITSLKGIEYFTNLKSLEFSHFESIGSFDISKNTALRTLEVSYSGLTTQDWSKNPVLERLTVHDCGLTTLDVSKNTALESLLCYNNQLTALDLSKNTALFNLDCSFNAIKKLDITKNSKLLPCVLQGTKTVGTDENGGSYVVYEWSSEGDEWAQIFCDPTTEIITGETKTSEDTSTVTAPTPTPAPVIAAVKKSSKTTITAAPGTTAKIDTGATAGKKFKSSNKKIATVDKNGNVTFKKAGKVKITFKVGKKKRTVTLKIVDPTVPKSVSLNMAGTNAVTKGESVTLTATLPEGTYSGIKWKSSNKKVATVSKTGVVNFKKKGKVTITATASRGKKKAKVKFKVGK